MQYTQLNLRGIKKALSRFSLPLLLMSSMAALYGCSGDGTGLDANGQPLSSNPVNTNDPYSAVQAIFTARCIACHAGAAAPVGLNLSAGLSFDFLVDVDSGEQPDLKLVEPGNAEASYLVHKIRGDSTISGARMPLNGPPFLSDEQVQTVIDWINDGALPPLDVDPNQEFNAQLSDFIGYDDWDQVDYSIGNTNVFLVGAHQGDSEEFSRRVFQNPSAELGDNDEYVNGSILVKEIKTIRNGSDEFASDGLLAMVKRGAGFNPDHNDWEWFVLESDLSGIVTRGADVMENGCNSCHSAADSQTGGGDYVFKHPSEKIAEDADFSGYTDWTVIDERSDNNPLLGAAHGISREGSTRRVYQKQIYANPVDQYPIGTILAKEVILDGEVIETTAMVKRGGDFNPQSQNWEWFFIDPETQTIMRDEDGNERRGGDLNNNGCTNCHQAATPASGEGIDLVFKHVGAPVNNTDEFVASASDFSNYLDWENVDYTISDINPAIGMGHQGANPEFSRRTYANDIAEQGDGYPVGTILVKEVTSHESGTRELAPELGLLAMVKRGGAFNPDNNGWEWFELSNDGQQILGRGGDYRNNGCNNCHLAAESQPGGSDYVFPHPSEFIAEDMDFTDYLDWTMIDERSDQNPLLGMAHRGNADGAVRRVFKKQLYAAPEEEEFGFPIGTIFVKEITQGGVITELGAMVKRGGSFNADHNNWEWFFLNPDDATIGLDDDGEPLRGGDLRDGGCNNCHSLAETGQGEGRDYVFFHSGDPLNAE